MALVHDWLVDWGGSESVLASLARLFPEAPIHTAVWDPDPRVEQAFGHRDVRPTFLQRTPAPLRRHRRLLPLMPRAFRSLDLSGFRLVISSSHAFSKAVRADASALHVCYCHTPPRYLWDLWEVYAPGPARWLLGPLRRWLQWEDRRSARGVDRFLANSAYVADRIRRIYGRDARVVHPPVDVERFRPLDHGAAPDDFYLAGGRLVRYKRVDLAVEAANRAGLPLRIFGDGPERTRLERMAGPSVEFLGRVGDADLASLLSRCRAFLFPGVEDFGILPVEAQAAGRPVAAADVGGVRETVRDGVTGILYPPEEGASGLLAAVEALRRAPPEPGACRSNALRFGRDRFEGELARALEGAG